MILDKDTYLDQAEKMVITGSIQKEYCSGELSGYFTYSPTFFPNEMTLTDFAEGFYSPQPYQYKFNNKEDELLVILKIKVYSTDVRIFESGEWVKRYKFTDIYYELDSNSAALYTHYIMVRVSTDPLWVRVTS